MTGSIVRTLHLLLFLGLMLPNSTIEAREQKEGEAAKRPDIQKLIEALGAESFSKREAAFQKLKGMGKAILPELKQQLKTVQDAETKERLKRIIASHLELVAVISPARLQATVATRGLKNDPSIIILDGTRSKSKHGKTLKYQWKQVDGDDLELKREYLAKSRVGLKIYHSGKYRFQLVVSVGSEKSSPAFVDIEVKNKAEKK